MSDSYYLPLIGGVVQPQRFVLPPEVIQSIPDYRHACRLAWKLRQIRGMTKRTLCELSGMYASHVTDYLGVRENSREMPARHIAAFERIVGNTCVSQWIAHQSNLTICEEKEARRAAA